MQGQDESDHQKFPGCRINVRGSMADWLAPLGSHAPQRRCLHSGAPNPFLTSLWRRSYVGLGDSPDHLLSLESKKVVSMLIHSFRNLFAICVPWRWRLPANGRHARKGA